MTAKTSPVGLKRKAWSIAWPAMVEMQAGEVAKVATLILIGNLGPSATAGVGLTHQMLFFISMLIMGISVGTVAMVSQAYGAGRGQDVAGAAMQGWMAATLIGGVISILMVTGGDTALRLLGAQPDVIEAAVGYTRWYGLSAILQSWFMVQVASIRATGNTLLPFRLHLVGQVAHLLAVLVLVRGWGPVPAMGVVGAGIAHFLGQLTNTILMHRAWVRLLVHEYGYTIWQLIKPAPDIVRRLLRVGGPAMAERMVLASGQLIFIRTVAGLGTEVYASHQILLNVNNLVWTFTHGYVIAVTVMVGQLLGAGKPVEAAQSARQGAWLSTGLVSVLSIALMLGADRVAGVFSSDPDVAGMAASVMPLILIFQAPQAIYSCINGALQGAGDTRFTLIAAAIGVWMIRNPLMFLSTYAFHWGLFGAWMIMALDFWMRGGLAYWRFAKGDWQRLRV